MAESYFFSKYKNPKLLEKQYQDMQGLSMD